MAVLLPHPSLSLLLLSLSLLLPFPPLSSAPLPSPLLCSPSLVEGQQYTFAKSSMTLQLVLTPDQRRLLMDGAHKAHLRWVARCSCGLVHAAPLRPLRRFCCHDTKTPQKDAYPLELRVTVNGIRMVIEVRRR